jgi:hypothetical protein
MELIKSRTFYNSYSNEHLATIALYKSELGYVILNEVGANLTGVTRLTSFDAEEFYLDLVHQTRKGLNAMGQPFHTKSETLSRL